MAEICLRIHGMVPSLAQVFGLVESEAIYFACFPPACTVQLAGSLRDSFLYLVVVTLQALPAGRPLTSPSATLARSPIFPMCRT